MISDYADLDGLIWLNGELVPWRDAKVHVLTHTLHYGLGVFEGVRAYAGDSCGNVFRLNDHSQRLLNSAKLTRMPVALSKEEINEAHLQVLRANNLQEGYIRPLLFLGSEGVGLRSEALSTNLMVAAWEWPSYLPVEVRQAGIRLKTSVMRRSGVESGLNKAKVCGQYVQSLLALKEAVGAGYDEALMLDSHGYVCEGSGENVFCVKNGQIYTPPATSCLEGITRDTIMQIARAKGYSVQEVAMTIEDFLLADEVFMTGTAAEVMPIASIDQVDIGVNKHWPIATDLANTYTAVVRGKESYSSDWLTPIPA